MKLAVVGVGAVGLGLATCIAQSPARLHLVTRTRESARVLGREGFARRGLFGEVRVASPDFDVHASMAALAEVEPDFVLVCTKSHTSGEVAAAMEPIWKGFASPTPVILCQNGWGNAERFADHLPREVIFNGRVITGFRRIAATEVEVTVHAQSIRMGSLFGRSSAVIRPVCEIIDRGGIPCEPTDEIARDLWAKVLYNGLLNPLGALIGVPYGELAERRELRAVMEAAGREIFAVMRAAGYETHWDGIEEYLAAFYGDLLPPTASHESSMLLDVRAHRPTEIHAISGAVADLGDELGVPTPVNRSLCRLIEALS